MPQLELKILEYALVKYSGVSHILTAIGLLGYNDSSIASLIKH